MCADASAALPAVFHGLYLFMAEAQDSEGLKPRPTFFTQARGDRPVFERMYRRMAGLLGQAASEVDAVESQVPERHRVFFTAEASSIRWFYRTIRTTANFYASCRLRDRLQELAAAPGFDRGEATAPLEEWRQVLLDEQENVALAIPLAKADVRLDFYYGSDHTFPHLGEMLAAKQELIAQELAELLPAVARIFGR
jgi:hypothetical protein